MLLPLALLCNALKRAGHDNLHIQKRILRRTKARLTAADQVSVHFLIQQPFYYRGHGS